MNSFASVECVRVILGVFTGRYWDRRQCSDRKGAELEAYLLLPMEIAQSYCVKVS